MTRNKSQPTYTFKEKLFSGAFLTGLIVVVINWIADLHWFAPYDGLVFGVCIWCGVVYGSYIGNRLNSYDLAVWRYFGAAAFGAAVFPVVMAY